jgi:hypothetical protein
MSNTVSIYGLRSSQDGRLRYVGQTSQPLRQRYHSHVGKAMRRTLKGYLSSWIISVHASGHQVEIFEIEAGAERNTAEIAWINLLRSEGARLVNGTDGGEGGLGAKRGPMSEDVKAKIRAAKVGTKLSAEHKAAIGKAHANRFFSSEHRARISAARMGHAVSDDTRQKLSTALRGIPNPRTAEMNRRRREAQQ